MGKIVHGQCFKSKKTPEYKAWAEMRSRCFNPKNRIFKYYGGRGISICSEWNNFENFFKDMGRKISPRHSLERSNNEIGYNKDNCVWATRNEQARNKRNTVIVSDGTLEMCLKDWAAFIGIPYKTLHSRIRNGWALDRAIGRKGCYFGKKK